MESSFGKTFAFSVFVFDTQTGELRRNGRPLQMPDQVARLLTILLENSGSMVTREQLRIQLWPDGEAVDYDHSINRAVSKLRAVLRDRTSKSAHYIDTLPKRGYRFVAPLREVSPSDKAIGANEQRKSHDLALAEEGILMPPDVLPTVFPYPILELLPSVEPVAKNSLRRLSGTMAVWIASATLLIAAWVGFTVHRSRQAVAAQTLSLGIVPFETSGDGASALAESFRFDLADSLSQIPTIEVRASHSFDNLGQDQSQIQARAQRLNIAAILFGKFTVTGDACQLRLELVRSRDGVHLLSLQYSATRDQLATIRDRIDQDIFQRLHPSEQAEALTLAQPSSPKAYAAYLRGRSYLLLWTDDALQQSIQAFQEALRYDPRYARAYAGMSSAYFVLAQHGVGDHNANLEKTREFALKAVALDGSLAEAHAMLGEVALTKDWNFPVASQELLQATELDPSHAIYHQWLSILYCAKGQYRAALAEIDKAHAADPDWAPPYMTEIYVAGSAQDFPRADRAGAILIRKMPDWPLAYEQNAATLWNSKRYAAAIDEWHRAAVMEHDVDRAHLEERGAEALRTGGVPAYARIRLEAIKTRKGVSHEENDFIPAQWYAYAGDWNNVLDDLQRLLGSHSAEALQIGADPAYAPLHKDPRFLDMMKHFGLSIPESSPLPEAVATS